MDLKALQALAGEGKSEQLMATMQALAQQNPQYLAALQSMIAAQAQSNAAAAASSGSVPTANSISMAANSTPQASSNSAPTAVLPQYSVPTAPHGGSKYSHLLMIIEEINKDIRPTYSGNRNCAERLKRGINHARVLVRECLLELDKQSRANASSSNQ